MLIKVGTTNIPVEAHSVVVWVSLSLNDIKPVSYEVRVLSAPLKHLYFLDRNVPAKIVHFSFWVATISLQS